MRAPALRALGFLSGADTASAGRPAAEPRPTVLSLGRPAASDDRRRRATRECRLAIAAVEAMLADGKVEPSTIAGERTALLYATAAGYAASNRAFIEGKGGSIHFAYTAPAVVPAEVAIGFGVTGPYAIFLGGPPATLRAIWQAAILLEAGACDRALVLAVEIFDECADLYARTRRLVGRPLVEAAGCLWLEPGRGEIVFESARGGRPRADEFRAATGEMLGCEPLARLDRWRRARSRGPLELSGRWRGEEARLVWRGIRDGRALGHPGGAPRDGRLGAALGGSTGARGEISGGQ